MAKIVNSWNEWDLLKRVVVGSAEGANWPANEPGVHNNGDYGGFGYGYWGMWPQDQVDEACTQQDEFANILRKRGVTVDRVVGRVSGRKRPPPPLESTAATAGEEKS